jgi:hypothetical protein
MDKLREQGAESAKPKRKSPAISGIPRCRRRASLAPLSSPRSAWRRWTRPSWRPDAARYPLDKLLQSLAAKLIRRTTFAIQVRGCDERGLNELYKWGQLDPDKVVLVGVACSHRSRPIIVSAPGRFPR